MAVNWVKIRNEYINGTISYRKLAEKHGIPWQTLRDRACQEKWMQARKTQRNIIGTKTEQKTAEKIAENEADRAARIAAAADRIMDKLEQAIEELDKRIAKSSKKTRVIEYNDPNAMGKPTKEVIEERETFEDISVMIDRQGLQQISTALKNIRDITREDMGTESTEAAQKLDAVLSQLRGADNG